MTSVAARTTWQICLVVCAHGFASFASAQDSQRLPTVPGTASFPTIQDFRQADLPIAAPNTNAYSANARAEETLTIPLANLGGNSQDLEVRSESQQNGKEQLVSIYARSVDLRLVLSHLAQESKTNILVAEDVDAKVTTTLNRVPLWQVLDAILKINGLAWTEHENIIFVTKPTISQTGVQSQSNTITGLHVHVFELNYTMADEILLVVQGLLSPAGQAFVHSTDNANGRKSRERIVVEDVAERIATIAEYINSVDNPPRQVLIEAHVLQVTLTDSQRHGVNLDGLARVANARVNIRAQGFANGALSPGFMMGLDGNDLDGMLEALRSDSNVRTLAAPKVLVVNGQEARIQIGSKFGYFVTTTSTTSTLQSVEFLEIGVVLVVEPTITRDGQVMLHVQPKVSGGRVNSDTGLPEEDTTEAQTTVILPDGKGMIIGGLIKEADEQQDSWIPWLGTRPFIGKLFRRSNRESSRIEVVIALTPHIVPFTSGMIDAREQADYLEAAQFNRGVIDGGFSPVFQPQFPEQYETLEYLQHPPGETLPAEYLPPQEFSEAVRNPFLNMPHDGLPTVSR